MKIKRTIFFKFRIFLLLSSSFLVGLMFQNCGQQGAISVTQDPNLAGVTGVTVIPDPVTLITNPQITINNKAPTTQSSDVTLQLSAVGAEEMLISNDSACASADGWIAYSQNKAWTLAQNNQQVTVYAKFRKKGAPETACLSASIIHDNVPPQITYGAFVKYTKATDVSIQYMAGDAVSGIKTLLCQIDNQPEGSCPEALNFANLTEERKYVFSMRAIDVAGNTSAKVSDFFIVDRTAPALTINGPKGVTANPNLNYSLLVVEANPLRSLQCRLAPFETDLKDCSGLVANYANMPAGSYELQVVATDMAGNVGQTSQSVQIDVSVPTVVITKGPPLIGRYPKPTFEFSGTSGGQLLTNFACSLDGINYAACSSPLAVTQALADHEYTFSLYGTNAAGVKSTVQTYKFIVDTLPPVIKITSALPAAIIKTNAITFSLSATDLNGLSSVTCYLNGQMSDCAGLTAPYAGLADGNYTFAAKAIDRAGNAAETAAVTFKIDTTNDSKILAGMEQNPILEGSTAQLNVTLTSVTSPSYKCTKVLGGAVVSQGAITASPSSYQFTLTENTSCVVSGIDKLGGAIQEKVLAQVNCGNRVNQNGQCFDFKCTSVISLPYAANLVIPARTGDGLCYAVKMFDAIPYGDSALSPTHDNEVVSRDHGGALNGHPFILGKALVNFKLMGARTAKLSGGVDATSPIRVDNYVLVGLYPKAVSPLPSHYAAQGTADARITDAVDYILMNQNQIKLKTFAQWGTATVAPLQIVNEADVNLDYMLDLRALDCGGFRELSNIYLLFQ